MVLPDAPGATTNLDAALAYAACGWRVIPIRPGSRVPALSAWQREGSTDEQRIRHWWGSAPDHGVGIVTGPESGIWVLDVDVKDGKRGDESLAELVDGYGPLPDTYEVITGTGGRHLYFRWPASAEIRNEQSGRFGDGLDVRGRGGYVVAPPSIHDRTHRAYEVEVSAADEVADAPEWLVALVEHVERTPEPRQEAGRPTGDRPGDQWAASVTWAEILTADGWALHHVDRDNTEHWTRPGKDRREGTSATVGYKGSDVLKVFTSSHPHLSAEATYTRVGYLAATRHGGDHTETARALRALGYGADRVSVEVVALDALIEPETAPEAGGGDWAPVDLAAVLSGHQDPPRPTILRPPGGTPLLYPGRVNSMFGEAGVGKTWIELAAISEVIGGGGTAMLIDLEDTAHGIASRLRLLGLSDAVIADGLVYLAPSTPWGPQAQAAVAGLLAERSVDLVCIDSTGEAMAAAGVKGNDDDDVARWFVGFPRWIANRGPAVLVVDHIPKDTSGPSLSPIGSQRKLAAINGAAYRVDAITVPSQTADGLLKLTCAKDRHGNHRKGDEVATVAVTHPALTRVAVTLRGTGRSVAPAEIARPTHLMEAISRLLEAHPGLSGREIESRVNGRAQTIRRAVQLLTADGYIEQDPTARMFAYRVARPFSVDVEETELHGL